MCPRPWCPPSGAGNPQGAALLKTRGQTMCLVLPGRGNANIAEIEVPMKLQIAIALLICALFGGRTAEAAEIVESTANGVMVRHVVTVAAAPDKVWTALVNVAG